MRQQQRMANEAHDSIETMASSYAQRAVELGREFDAALDFSENSIMELETILDQCAHHVRADRPNDDDLAELCKTWGCYLGEVVRRRFGGEWSIETYPGKQFATLTLSIAGNKMYPSIKVHRRISQSAEENVWTFYKMVKQRLETTQQRVQ
jgi:hypothetical protein